MTPTNPSTLSLLFRRLTTIRPTTPRTRITRTTTSQRHYTPSHPPLTPTASRPSPTPNMTSDSHSNPDPSTPAATGHNPASTPPLPGSTSHPQPSTSPNPPPTATATAQALPALPALPAVSEDNATGAAPQVLQVDGAAVVLDHLGPMVVGRDGTVSRIANWGEMAEVERENTLRVLGKRNQARLAALRGEKKE